MENEVPFCIVERFQPELDWTLSEFFIANKKECVGVEDEFRKIKVKGETRIDEGIFELDLRFSPKFSKKFYVNSKGELSKEKTTNFNIEHLLIWIKGTPRHEFVLIHWGNTDDDTDGCYIIGKTFATFNGQRGVTASQETYMRIYPLIFNKIMENKKLGLKTYIQFKDK